MGLGVAPGTSVGVGNGVAVGVAVGISATVAIGIGVALAETGVGVSTMETAVGVSTMETAVGVAPGGLTVAVPPGWTVAVATSGSSPADGVIAIVVGVGLISGVGSAFVDFPDTSFGSAGVAVGTGRYGSPPLSGVPTRPGISPAVPPFSTVGSCESTGAETLVDVGELISSGSLLPHAEITTANNAAKISANICRRDPIKDSMKSLSASHNGCITPFVMTVIVTKQDNR